jgi:hypothetical protein
MPSGDSRKSDGSTALACLPDAIPREQRAAHVVLVQQLFGRLLRDRLDLPHGYEFGFGPESFEAIAAFVVNERKCCPFVTFELVAAAGEGPVTLRMTGPAGTREVLQAELISREPRESHECA